MSERTVVLKVRRPGETAYVLAIAPRGLGVTSHKPAKLHGSRANPRLEGFRIAWMTRSAIGLERGAQNEERAQVDVEPGRVRVHVGAQAQGVWTDMPEGAAREGERDAWQAQGATLAEVATRDAVDVLRTEVTRAVKRATVRLSRRAEAVKSDLARIADARAVAEQLPWLVAEASRAPRGARSLQVTDWSTGEARAIEVPLDPSKPARAQVEAMFARARRLKQGAEIARARLAQTEAILAKLAPLASRLIEAKSTAEVESALIDARAAAPRDVKLDVIAASGKRETQAKAPPYRAFRSRDGRARILVGRGAAHNDALTFQIARPHDLWLHAQGLPGAHVIVQLGKGQTCPPEVLVDAAHLAAHFSDARDEAVVDVQYAQRRHLRKPRGSAPGLVVVDREKVIAVRIDSDALRTLLEGEDA